MSRRGKGDGRWFVVLLLILFVQFLDVYRYAWRERTRVKRRRRGRARRRRSGSLEGRERPLRALDGKVQLSKCRLLLLTPRPSHLESAEIPSEPFASFDRLGALSRR